MTAPILEPEVHPIGNAQASLASLFDAVCARHADRVAVTLDGADTTYRQLKQNAGKVQAALVPAAGSIVAIYLDRSVAMVAAMLGTIKAGATYLPLDTSYPATRIMQTLADAQPAYLLTTRALAATLPLLSGHSALSLIFTEELQDTPASLLPQNAAGAEQIAYVIYTSGSTGQPKGVRVTHRNVIRLFTETERVFHFSEQDVWTMFHSFAFDFSVWEMWGPLLTGGRLVIVPFVVSRSPEDFYALLAAQRVTVLNQTPSAFLLFSQHDAGLAHRDLALRLVILGGEALKLQTLRSWFARHGDAIPEIINMYGITETTVHVTYRRIRALECESETESLIGQPIGDLRLHLLDDTLQPVHRGEPGEICIAGAGVAAGYLGRPELTAQRFVPDPFHAGGATLYRSGDLGRLRADGEFVYLGRADRQVKINGFRMELGEIETALLQCSGVLQASVLVHSDHTAGQRLAAYYVGQAAPQALSCELRDRLPAQMRPAFYTRLLTMPLNQNGKIDQAAFPSPLAARTESAPIVTSGMEATVSAVWQAVLERAVIGRDDNFFDIGGTSLLLIAVRSALQARLERTIPITLLFEFTSIRTLAAQLSSSPASSVQEQEEARTRADRQRASFTRARAQRSGSR